MPTTPYPIYVYAAGNPPTLMFELDLSSDDQGFAYASGLAYNQPSLTISGTPIPGAIIPPNPQAIPQQAINCLLAPVLEPPLPRPPPQQVYIANNMDIGANFVYIADFAYTAGGLECGNLLQGSLLGLETPQWRSKVTKISWTGTRYPINAFAKTNIIRLDLDTAIDRILTEGEYLTIVTP